MPGLFYCYRSRIRADGKTKTMTQTYSKSRQQAEVAFGNVQSQFFGRGNAVEEHDVTTQARDDKTARLREARLAKEQLDRSNAVAALATKRAKTSR